MRINLLPPELLQRRRARRRTIAVVLVGVLVLVGLGGFYLLQQVRLQNVQEDLEVQQATNAQLQQRIDELRRFDELRQELEAREALLANLLANEVFWSGVLRDISLVIPGETWLTSLSGAIAEPAATTAPGTLTGLVGQMTFSGFGFTHRSVALLLTRFEDVRGFVNPWLSNSQKTLIGTRGVVQFTSSVDLSDDALARRQQA